MAKPVSYGENCVAAAPYFLQKDWINIDID